MKITLTLDPVDDGQEAMYAFMHASDLFSAMREYDERLRQAHKYSEDDADVLHAGPGYFREMLHRVLSEFNVSLEDY